MEILVGSYKTYSGMIDIEIIFKVRNVLQQSLTERGAWGFR